MFLTAVILVFRMTKVDSDDPAIFLTNSDLYFHHRSCTDIICCLIFLAYIVGMIVVGVVGENYFYQILKAADPSVLNLAHLTYHLKGY